MNLLEKLLFINEFRLKADNSYFHISSTKNEKSICKKGLLASKSGQVSDFSLQGAVYFTKNINRFLSAFKEFDKGEFTVFKIKDDYVKSMYFYDDNNAECLLGTCYYTLGDVPPEYLEIVGYVSKGEFRVKY